MDDLEGRSKRNNLIFTGLMKKTASDYKSWEDCENLVRDVIRDKLKITEEVSFERVHRMKGQNSPIIACFTKYKDKQTVLKAKKKLGETQEGKKIFIGEDYSKKVRETRRKLVPFLKEARDKEKKRAHMVFDHLVIEGKRFYYDSARNCLTDSK